MRKTNLLLILYLQRARLNNIKYSTGLNPDTETYRGFCLFLPSGNHKEQGGGMGAVKRDFMASEYDQVFEAWKTQSLYMDGLEQKQLKDKEELKNILAQIDDVKARTEEHLKQLEKLAEDIDNSISIRLSKIERVRAQLEIKEDAKERLCV